MNRMLEFLQEDNGGISSMRLMSFIIVIVVCWGYVYQILHTPNHQSQLDINSIIMVLGVISLKVGQKFGEQKINQVFDIQKDIQKG